MKTNTRRMISAIAAAAMVIAIVLTGSFAWQSVNQEALNETRTEINPGGRLHDDFNGTNKDVYVENFTDPENGGVPIFARIRLDEYMEIGEDAGINRTAANRKATSLVPNADINRVSSWTTHTPQVRSDICTNGTPETFHDFWSWEMGGKTVYMPTFNKNKDSLKADINGTYAGPDTNPDTVADRYLDYQTYPLGQTVTGVAVYDADNNTVDEGASAVLGTHYTENREAHTAKETQTAAVITMAEWKALGRPAGNYWVYDTDGWAYWAEAIQPGEATGLLLSGIRLDREPDEDCYYAINVVAQFASRGDWGAKDNTGFYDSTKGLPPSDDALYLLNQAAGMTPEMSLTDADGNPLPASVPVGSSIQLKTALTWADIAIPDQRVVWTVSGSKDLHADTVIDENGLLTVSAQEDPANILIVKVVSVADPRASVSVNIPLSAT